MSLEIFVIDELGVVQDQIDVFSQVSVTLKQNDISAWSVDAFPTSASTLLMTPGYSVSIQRNNQTVISGPMTGVQRDSDESNNKVTLSGVSDEAYLSWRLAWPSLPVAQGDGTWLFPSSAYYNNSGPAESVILDLAFQNLGGGVFSSGDWSERQLADFSTATDVGRGNDVSVTARFQSLLELFQKYAASGGVNFAVIDRQLHVSIPQDRTNEIVFSFDMGNVRSLSYSTEAPSATHVLVAGGGEGVDRIFWEDSDTAQADTWHRVELFSDARDTVELAELSQRAQEALVDGQQKSGLSVVPLNTPGMEYGTDYQLGDLVTAVVDGIEIQDIVRQIDLTFSDTGETIQPSIESETTTGAASALRIFDYLKSVERRVGLLERSQ